MKPRYVLGENNMTHQGAAYLAQITSLRTLLLSGNQIGDQGLAILLESLPLLTSLDLSNKRLTSQSVGLILNNTHLTQVATEEGNISPEEQESVYTHIHNNAAKIEEKSASHLHVYNNFRLI